MPTQRRSSSCSRKGNWFAMLWEVDIYPAPGQPDRLAEKIISEAAELGIATNLKAVAATGYLLQGAVERGRMEQAAAEILSDQIVERAVIARVGDSILAQPPLADSLLLHVLPKAGVMDPVAESAKKVLQESGLAVDEVRTLRKFWVSGLAEGRVDLLASKVLANDAIEEVVQGPLVISHLDIGTQYSFKRFEVAI